MNYFSELQDICSELQESCNYLFYSLFHVETGFRKLHIQLNVNFWSRVTDSSFIVYTESQSTKLIMSKSISARLSQSLFHSIIADFLKDALSSLPKSVSPERASGSSSCSVYFLICSW